jgi:hypothetical protein
MVPAWLLELASVLAWLPGLVLGWQLDLVSEQLSALALHSELELVSAWASRSEPVLA